jgi:integrase
VTGYMRKRRATSWQLLVHIGHDGNGRKKYASKTVHGTKREAQVALAEFVTEVTKGGLVATAGPITVEKVVRAWLTAKAPRLSPSTVARYEVALKHIVPAIGKKPVARLRTSDIEDFYGHLLAAGQSGSSIRKVHWAMRQSLAWAKRHGYVATLATERCRTPAARRAEAESAAIIRCLRRDRVGAR